MRLFLFAVYVLVTLVCVAISVLALYEGALPLLGWPAVPIACVVGLALLAFDLELRSLIRNGGQVLRVVGALLVVTALSWTFIFTHFYGSAMRDDIVEGRLQQASARFDANVGQSRLALQAAMERGGMAARHTRARAAFDEMQRQALDRQNCGVGPETLEYRNQINSLLGTPITDLNPPAGCQAGEIRAWLEDIRIAMEAGIGREVQTDVLVAANAALDDALALKNAQIAAGLDASLAQQRAIIEDLVVATRTMQGKVNEALAAEGGEAISLEPVRTDRDRLRNITEVWSSAFVERPNFGMTIYAGLFALMIDLFPMIVAFVLFRRESGGDVGV
ncbi:MAG TPA: hypothetical protein VM915_12055, partial [Verrucomicrobiae bacterium]|nr:hypothetical protein [Verrucomicrobiae bacterium]